MKLETRQKFVIGKYDVEELVTNDDVKLLYALEGVSAYIYVVHDDDVLYKINIHSEIFEKQPRIREIDLVDLTQEGHCES